MKITPQTSRMFQLAIELAEKIKNNSKHLIASDEEELLYKGAMLFFFSKAYKSYQAIKTLWENGFAEDAFVLARTIFEIALQARYMTKEPRTRARLFFEHDPVHECCNLQQTERGIRPNHFFKVEEIT